MKKKIPLTDIELIEAAGGTMHLARLCRIKPPSISGWKKRDNIPLGQRQFLSLAIPNLPWMAKVDAQNG